MKAIVIDSCGGAEKLQLRELPDPHLRLTRVSSVCGPPVCLKPTLNLYPAVPARQAQNI
jgi:hypothetical protein